jgi:hypothetical protein
MTDRQHNGQKKEDKRTNNDLQNITHTTEHFCIFNDDNISIYFYEYNISISGNIHYFKKSYFYRIQKKGDFIVYIYS